MRVAGGMHLAAWSNMVTLRKLAVVGAIGVLAALIWLRLGLYGFGLPRGLLALLPVFVAGRFYLRARQIRALGVLLEAFALTWVAFETWVWMNAATDPAVSIPGWSPLPLASAAVLLLVGVGLVGGAKESRSEGT